MQSGKTWDPEHFMLYGFKHLTFNPFDPNVPFLYSLKTSENRKIFWYFQGVEKGCTANEWIKNTEIYI